ncbi:Txe/YoeB family addiction module toxin [Aureimonas leprariae]|uniref:Putative mRNA interferase YoeB n=1 Tax=Plantimonas leprariae TaxID=2615207 RepID=A0A7V7U237_9HYPH|nr:Txe/YoeB family addiction module toxin [Aureimonas leprariae]KAB0682958.1 Txe/YoeB family addiction module toxin [Aureimonas leprariae]
MRVMFTPEGWADYLSWQEADPAVLKRINELIAGARRAPFTGIGKPEPLRSELAGWWSRRIDREHRLVYRVEGKDAAQTLIVAACRFRYSR